MFGVVTITAEPLTEGTFEDVIVEACVIAVEELLLFSMPILLSRGMYSSFCYPYIDNFLKKGTGEMTFILVVKQTSIL